IPPDGRGRFIMERMAVDDLALHKWLIQNNRQIMSGIVDHAENSDRTGDNAQKLHHLFGFTERNPAGSPDKRVDRLQVNRRILLDRDEIMPLLTVAQEEILRMSTRNVVADATRF